MAWPVWNLLSSRLSGGGPWQSTRQYAENSLALLLRCTCRKLISPFPRIECERCWVAKELGFRKSHLPNFFEVKDPRPAQEEKRSADAQFLSEGVHADRLCGSKLVSAVARKIQWDEKKRSGKACEPER